MINQSSRREETCIVLDCRTGMLISTHSSIKSARAKAERLDLEYGAYRYSAMTTEAYARRDLDAKLEAAADQFCEEAWANATSQGPWA